MFLSDAEIKKEIESGTISIHPLIDLNSQLGSCSLDLRIGQTFMVFRRSAIPYIDPLSHKIEEVFETNRVPFGQKIIIHPGMDVLTTTLEQIKLGLNIVGFVTARSSWIRLGLDISPTFGRIDPGFQGKIVMRLHNFSGVPIAIIPGMRICSLAFARISGIVERVYNGKYQRAESYEPKIFLDKDVQFLKVLPNGELDKLFEEKITASSLMQIGFQKLSSKLGDAHKRIILRIFKSGRTTTPRLATQLNYNKYYLSAIMKQLVENTIVVRSVIRGKGGGFFYELTEMGKTLAEYLERENPENMTFQTEGMPQTRQNEGHKEDICILEVNLIPRSSDSSQRLNEEYLILENRGKCSINLAGWKIVNLIPRGVKTHSYTFPYALPNGSSWQLEPRQRLRLVTGKGINHLKAKKAEIVFFWNREWFAWWPGDTVLLIDEEEKEVIRLKIQ